MDDKGGVVAGLYAMKILQQLDFRQYGQVTLLLNTNEETGSKGTRALIEREAKQHDVTLNLEPGRPADGLVVWRKGSGTAEIDIKGKAAHAGVAPESVATPPTNWRTRCCSSASWATAPSRRPST